MAQLVARLVRNEKVRGSNPLSSTPKPACQSWFFSCSGLKGPGTRMHKVASDSNRWPSMLPGGLPDAAPGSPIPPGAAGEGGERPRPSMGYSIVLEPS